MITDMLHYTICYNRGTAPSSAEGKAAEKDDDATAVVDEVKNTPKDVAEQVIPQPHHSAMHGTAWHHAWLELQLGTMHGWSYSLAS